MQTFLIYGDLAKRRLTDSSGTPATLPSLVQGDYVTFALRLLDTVDTGSPIEVQRNVRSLRASLGNVNTLPASGQFSLKIGTNGTATPLIDFNSDRIFLKPLLFALPEAADYGGVEQVIEATSGCWMVRFGQNIEVPLQTADNLLAPVSFIRVRPFEQNGRWWHEVRLMQAPIAFTGLSERVLAEPPSVRRIRAGTTYTEGFTEYIVNEIQAVKVPASFRGTYCLKFDGRSTIYFSKDDDPTAIETALNNLYTDGQTRFAVTNPEPYNAYVEFKGPLAGLPQDLLVAEVGSVEPGDLTFSLDLNTAEVFAALRNSASVSVQFEVELEIANDDDTAETPGKTVTLFREAVTIVRELQWAEMAAAAGIDWLRPPQPVDYIPFTRDEIITGSQHYTAVIGDGIAREFTLDHNLGTDALHITLRENTSNGRRIADTEYTATFVDANSLTITFPEESNPPVLNSLAITITSAGPKSAFQAHTHTVGQIVGLQAIIDSLSNRVSALESIVPNLGAVSSSSTSGTYTIPIPTISEVLFLPSSVGTVFSDSGLDATKLSSRAPYMLPAVHTATVLAFTALPFPAPAMGTVWQNQTGGALQVPGGGMVRGNNTVPANGFFASDGRILYRTNQAGATISYFPAAFERILWSLYINEKMLGVGKTLSVAFGVSTQLVKATSQAQWMLVIEKGEAPSETGGNPETNLLNVVWDTANPILKQRLILTPVATICYAGINVYRSTLGAITCDRLLYGGLENANAVAPGSANFALRARLIEFDTENSIPTARGWVAYQLTKPASGDLQAAIA
ncbi:MAG: hypothetical protein ACFUZC_07635 [Chthoniobacteraceae bacterium]